jgi:FtsX-like permease family protein/MacB-like protein
MLTITLRDLQWRARRFGLGVAAASLVFAVTLVLAGVYSSFQSEASRTVRTFHADRWIVPAGASGPFTASTPVGERTLKLVSSAPGVRFAEAVALFRNVVRKGSDDKLVNVIGAGPGGLFRTPIVTGRPLRGSREAVADERMGFHVGDRVTVGSWPVRVVGLTRGLTYLAGTPAIVISLVDGQRLTYQGAALASAIITRGTPTGPMAGLRGMTTAEVIDDLRRPMTGATTTVAVQALLLSIVAAAIIGLMAYLSGLDRMLDFAVFKAIGVRNDRLLGGLVLEVLLLALIAAVVGGVVARVMAPAFPIGVHFTVGTYLGLLGLALGVSLLVSLVSIRQAVRVDPALAFGRH